MPNFHEIQSQPPSPQEQLVELGILLNAKDMDLYHARAITGDTADWNIDPNHDNSAAGNRYRHPVLYTAGREEAMDYIKAKYKSVAFAQSSKEIMDFFSQQDPNLLRAASGLHSQKTYDDCEYPQTEERPVDYLYEENPEPLSTDELIKFRNMSVNFPQALPEAMVAEAARIIDNKYEGHISVHKLDALGLESYIINEDISVDKLGDDEKATYTNALQSLIAIADAKAPSLSKEELEAASEVSKLYAQSFKEKGWDARITVEDAKAIEAALGLDWHMVLGHAAILNTKAALISKGIGSVVNSVLYAGGNAYILERDRADKDERVALHVQWAIDFLTGSEMIGFRTGTYSQSTKRSVLTTAFFDLTKVAAVSVEVYTGKSE